jgi:hypothetical protein
MSVDYPVENFIIINNNGRGEIDSELDELCKITHPFIENIKVCHLPANLGVAGAWNLIIKSYMMAPWWVIVNDDVAFNPGLLQEIDVHMNADPHLGMIHPNKGDFGLGSYDLFVIRDTIVQAFGLFDENCYPAYCEDADYIMRLKHRPIKTIVGTEHGFMHGHGTASDYYNENVGSRTKKSSPEMEQMLEQANLTNFEYLNTKWGKDWRIVQPSKDPFGDPSIPISYTQFDLEFVRSKYTGF